MESQQSPPRIMKIKKTDPHCKVHESGSDPLHEISVIMVRVAPADMSASAIAETVSVSTSAIILPPRPPPLIFAPSAPALRAAVTRVSNSGDETVISCKYI